MKISSTIAAILPVAALGISLAACGGGSSGSATYSSTCWGTSPTAPGVAFQYQSKIKGMCNGGGIFGPSGPYSNLHARPAGASGTPLCTVTKSNGTTVWTVWDTGTTGDGAALCSMFKG